MGAQNLNSKVQLEQIAATKTRAKLMPKFPLNILKVCGNVCTDVQPQTSVRKKGRSSVRFFLACLKYSNIA